MLCSTGVDPLSNIGSLRNELILPPGFKGDDLDDDDLDDLMLGTTPNLGSTPGGVVGRPIVSGSNAAVRPGAATAASSMAATNTTAGFSNNSHINDVLLGRTFPDDDDELMGMSPDIPSMIRSPNVGSGGFGEFMRKAFGA